jgi:hypothetical protein
LWLHFEGSGFDRTCLAKDPAKQAFALGRELGQLLDTDRGAVIESLEGSVGTLGRLINSTRNRLGRLGRLLASWVPASNFYLMQTAAPKPALERWQAVKCASLDDMRT